MNSFSVSLTFTLALGAVALGLALYGYGGRQSSDKGKKKGGKKEYVKMSEKQLSMFNGQGQKRAFVAVDEAIWDVTRDKHLFKEEELGKVLKERDFKVDEYSRVGTLLVPRTFTRQELRMFDGRNSDTEVYVAAKGRVFAVDRNFYGPEGPYSVFAGRDASLALARVSLEESDLDGDINSLTAKELEMLDEWVEKFECKYFEVGTLTR